MKRPPHGLCVPVSFVECRDGDTIVVKYIERIWAIRLLDCWCAEKKDPGGLEAKAHAEMLIKKHEKLGMSVFVPRPQGPNLLKALTFDRVLGYVFLGDNVTLNELMVADGFATHEKC